MLPSFDNEAQAVPAGARADSACPNRCVTRGSPGCADREVGMSDSLMVPDSIIPALDPRGVGVRRWWALGALVMGGVAVGLDATVLSVAWSAGLAARILSPHRNATNGAIRTTRREAWVPGFDCGPVATSPAQTTNPVISVPKQRTWRRESW